MLVRLVELVVKVCAKVKLRAISPFGTRFVSVAHSVVHDGALSPWDAKRHAAMSAARLTAQSHARRHMSLRSEVQKSSKEGQALLSGSCRGAAQYAQAACCIATMANRKPTPGDQLWVGTSAYLNPSHLLVSSAGASAWRAEQRSTREPGKTAAGNLDFFRGSGPLPHAVLLGAACQAPKKIHQSAQHLAAYKQ